MLLTKLKTDLTTSLKNSESVKVETIRFLIAGIRNVAIDTYGAAGEEKMTDEDVLKVIKKQAKTHRESIDAFEKAGRTDLVATEKAQLEVLESYLPKEISDEELKAILAPVLQSEEKNFGLLMKQAMALVAGRADGGRVSAILKSKS